jgi:ubiquinone/menaquinone biosynthesis C-methylase UbiE
MEQVRMIATNDDVARVFDGIAAEYEAQLARNPVAGYMRAELHAQFARTFHCGEHILDFTAGTGIDAFFLAARGVRVTAIDISPAMIAELQRRIARRGWQIETRVLAAEHLSALGEHYDGAVSTFAGLNTILDMPRLAEDLARVIRPGGRVILHGLSEFCLWQATANVLRRRGERNGALCIGGERVAHFLYNPFALWRAAFAPHFKLRQAYGLSVVAAPALITRIGQIAPAVFWADRIVGRMLPATGDFFVLDLERRP